MKHRITGTVVDTHLLSELHAVGNLVRTVCDLTMRN